MAKIKEIQNIKKKKTKWPITMALIISFQEDFVILLINTIFFIV